MPPIDDYPNTTATTARITVGVPTYGTIETLNDIDVFRIDLQAGVKYTFWQHQMPLDQSFNLDSHLYLYTISGQTVLAHDDDGAGSRNSKFTYKPTTSGTYLVSAQANDYTNLGELTGSYRVLVQADYAPVITTYTATTPAGVAVPVTSLFSARDLEGYGIGYYNIYDPAGAGYLEYTTGYGITWNESTRVLVVPGGALSRVTYRAGTTGEVLQFAARDEELWSPWTNYAISPTASNRPPTISGQDSITLAVNATVTLANLFTASDSDGSITSYTVDDATPGSDGGYLTNNGTRISGTSITVTAANLSSLAYKTGPNAGSNTITITATDNAGSQATFSPTFNVERGNQPPVITGNTSPTFAANSTVQASSLFTASDPDGNGTIVRYTLQDASPGSDGGYLMLNGTRISGDSITVTASELSSVAYRTGPSAGSNALLITAYDSAGASATFTPTINVTVFTNNATPTRSSSEIFAAAAADGTNATAADRFDAGLLREMAVLAKAAYTVQTAWETPALNDSTPTAAMALAQATRDGWTAFTLNNVSVPANSSVAGITVTNRYADGFFTNGNAAAYVARSTDAIVIAFRGTNDNTEPNQVNRNPADPTNQYHPDSDQWVGTSDNMGTHYGLLKPLLSALDAYVASNGIAKVYVTGHSMGGAMALNYLNEHLGDARYQGVTFAAPGFWDGVTNKQFAANPKLWQIEMQGDPVPLANLKADPGKVVLIWGNETYAAGLPNSDNHSMDFYWQAAQSISPAGWGQILTQPGPVDVVVGAQEFDTYYVVDGRATGFATATQGFVASSAYGSSNDLLDLTDVAIPGGGGATLASTRATIYGGLGPDWLAGGNMADLLLGEAGNDAIEGRQGNDTVDGGDGFDMAIYSGERSQFIVTNEGGGQRRVTDNSTVVQDEGSDVLRRIERIEFADQGLAYDTAPTQAAGIAALLVGAVLGRQQVTLNPAVIGAVMSHADSGTTMQSLARLIMDVVPWSIFAGSDAPSDIATFLHRNVYGTAPDAASLNAAVNTLVNGATGDYLAQLASSAANQASVNLTGLGSTGLVYDLPSG